MNRLYYVETLKKYATFKGRASRSEYWIFTLINFGIFLALVFNYLYVQHHTLAEYFDTEALLLDDIFSLIILIPTFAVGYRRVHDVNHKGWHSLIPLYSLYLFFQKGTPGPNLYGAEPQKTP